MPCNYAQTGETWELLEDARKPQRDEAVLQLSESSSVKWSGITKECSNGCEPQPLDKSDCAIVYARFPYRMKAVTTYDGEEYSLHKVRALLLPFLWTATRLPDLYSS
jgi:hypothetical protein